jgi:hypothetical protein
VRHNRIFAGTEVTDEASDARAQRLKVDSLQTSGQSTLAPGKSSSLEGLVALQRFAGNKALTSLLRPNGEAVRPAVEKAVASPSSVVPADASASRSTAGGPGVSALQLHSDSESTEALGAKGFTVYNHVVLHPDFAPGTAAGDSVLAHEKAHFAQQANGPVSGQSIGANLAVSDPHDSFEVEAASAAHGSRHQGAFGSVSVSTSPVSQLGAGRFAAAPGGHMTIQRAVVDGGASLEALLVQLQGMSAEPVQAPKQGFFSKLKQTISTVFSRGGGKAKRSSAGETARSAAAAYEVIHAQADKALALRSRMKDPLGPARARRVEAADMIEELSSMKKTLGRWRENFAELHTELPVLAVAIEAIDHDIACVREVGFSDQYPDNASWLDAIEHGGAILASGKAHVDSIAQAQQDFTDTARKEQRSKDKSTASSEQVPQGASRKTPEKDVHDKTIAQVGRGGVDLFRDYVKGYAASAILPAAQNALDGFWSQRAQSESSDQADDKISDPKTDPRVTGPATELAEHLGPVVCPQGGGWAVADPEVLSRAAAILQYAEEKFGQGSDIAEAFVLRNMVWLGVQAQLLVYASNYQKLPRAASVESMRAFMEAIFNHRNQSVEEVFAAWEPIVSDFNRTLLAKVREHMGVNLQMQNVD